MKNSADSEVRVQPLEDFEGQHGLVLRLRPFTIFIVVQCRYITQPTSVKQTLALTVIRQQQQLIFTPHCHEMMVSDVKILRYRVTGVRSRFFKCCINAKSNIIFVFCVRREQKQLTS